jgi:hypothetical protein
MDGMKVENVNNRVVMLGDEHFEGGVITIPAGATIAAGTVLKRDADGKFAPVTNTAPTPGTHGTPAAGGGWDTEPTDPIPGDVPTAVMPFDITSGKTVDADFGFRALVAGRVRADMLRINGNPLSAEQKDLLREVGILPVKVTDLSHLDNQ